MFSYDQSPKPVWRWNADGIPMRDALAVLRDAVERCGNQDMRTPDVLGALAYLREESTRRYIYGRFLRSLNIENPADRSSAVFAAYDNIIRHSRWSNDERLRLPRLCTESEASQES